MKAILVLDEMPESCSQCTIFNFNDLTCLGCKVSFKEVGKVQSWCPLKPMPEKSCYSPFQSDVGIVKLNNAFIDGYNACIDEILGVKNHE